MPRVSIQDHFAELAQDQDFKSEYLLKSLAAELAFQIAARRKELGLGQAEIATRMGTTQSRVSQMEDPHYGKLNVSTLVRLADALSCMLEERLVPHTVPSKQIFEPIDSASGPKDNVARIPQRRILTGGSAPRPPINRPERTNRKTA